MNKMRLILDQPENRTQRGFQESAMSFYSFFVICPYSSTYLVPHEGGLHSRNKYTRQFFYHPRRGDNYQRIVY